MIPQEGSCFYLPYPRIILSLMHNARTTHTRSSHQVSLDAANLEWRHPPYEACELLSYCVGSVRNRLTALKKNRGEYIKSSDVLNLYNAIIKQGVFSSIEQTLQPSINYV